DGSRDHVADAECESEEAQILGLVEPLQEEDLAPREDEQSDDARQPAREGKAPVAPPEAQRQPRRKDSASSCSIEEDEGEYKADNRPDCPNGPDGGRRRGEHRCKD